jgi:hypothetical protein
MTKNTTAFWQDFQRQTTIISISSDIFGYQDALRKQLVIA